MACVWILKDTETGSVDKIFSTESDLDLYLKTKYDELEKSGNLKGLGMEISKIFDISPQEKTDLILQKIKEDTIKLIESSDVFEGMEGESVKLHDHPDYIGVTEAISTIGNPKIGWDKPIVNKFDTEKRIAALIESLTSNQGYSIDDAVMMANNQKLAWQNMTEYGEEIHAIYEAIFSDKEIPKCELLTDQQVKDAVEMAKDFKRSLQTKYGINAKFYSEWNIATTDIDPDLKVLLPNNKKGISGTIDLLIIDDKGIAHLYDFKTSPHYPGDWNTTSKDGWHKNKKIAIQNQLAAYVALLNQVGITVGSTHIVPIKMNFVQDEKLKLTGLTNFSQEQVLDNIPGTLGGDEYRNWHIIIPRPFKFDAKTLVDVDKKIQHLLPVQSIISQKIEKETKDIAYYRGQVRRLSTTDPQAHSLDGKKHYKYKFYPRELGKSAIFWENDEQMEQGLQDFVSELKNVRAKELDNLAINIQKAMSGVMSVDDLDQLLSDQKKNFLADQIRRYVRGGWSFVRDEQLNAFGIFIFQKDGRSEIVGITNQALGTAFRLSKGSSILGKTRYDKDVNSKDILDATTGNMELMRLMTYIAENQDLFKENKITQIKVINPWHGSQYVELNSVLENNYNLLVQDNIATFTDGELHRITEDIFYKDTVSLLSIADELLADAQEKSYGIYEFDRNNIDNEETKKYTEDWLSKQIWNLRKKYTFLNSPEVAGKGDPRIWEAYNYLLRAALAVKGLRMVQEFDVDYYLNSHAETGTAINSTGFSPSANIRVFDDIMQEYATEVRTTVEKLGRPLVTALDNFYRSKGKNRIIGGEYTVFKEWFITNPDGSIHESFSLKDPSDTSLSKESREALKIWLDIMSKLRWPNATPEDIEKYKADGTYYQVPLTEATFGKQTKNLGILNALRNKWKQYSELTQDVFAGETEKKMNWRQGENGWRLYNKFNLTQQEREDKLRGKVGFFETDLEMVMNQALVAYTKANVSPKYISRLNALSVSLKMSESYGGQMQRATQEALDKLIKSKFYGESIIEGETMQAFARWLNVIKKGLSFMSLGFNFRSFAREFLQGTWMGINRAGLNTMPGVTKETYIKAYEHVLTQAYKNFSSVSLLQQLDARYGVANYSLGNISRKRRLDWTGIRNWNSDTAFWGSTSPDFQHRLTILVAKMMGDGSWEAYSLNDKGDLVYDWTKDKRFSICAQGLKTGDHSNPEFANQYSLYMEYINELNRVGKKFKDELGVEREYQEGDALPEAYLPREIQAIKNYSDLLYGHYDDESRSLIHDTFLGSFFMQYKTYITSRIEQWTLNPGTYNTEFLQWETDPVTGEHLYRVHNDPDPDGRPNIEIKRESQIKNMDQLVKENRIEKLYVWKGIPMEGIARSYINFFKRFKELGWANFKELKNNPVERDNLILGLHDTLFASFMLLLVTGLFGLILDGEWTTDHTKIAREARKNGWLPSFGYNILYGSWTDFAPWNNAWSIVGDWNPPALTAAKRVVENAGAVVLGKKSVFQAVTNTVGAAADLKGIADRLADL